MKAILNVIIVALVCGCASPVFVLGSHPQSTGCSSPECKQLDAIVAENYALVRSGKITWAKMVDDFYIARAQLFPKGQINDWGREYIAYQRFLAEQMDNKKITEAEWAYLLEKKVGELNARNKMVQNAQSNQTECKTKAVGMPPFQTFKTYCY